MKILFALSWQYRLLACGWIAACAMVASQLGAQSPAPRITSEITNTEQATLRGSLHPMAQPQFDAGRVPAETILNGISIVFSRSAEQETNLQELIAAQQDPSSPLYHQWLTPDEFAARFGMADADLAKVTSWLQQQGFTVDSVARSRNMIRFSGTVRQVEAAFSTEMHYYNVQGKRHMAPSTELSVPATLASVVLAVRNLHDFRPKSMHIRGTRPDYTVTSSSGTFVLFAPGDIKTAYGIPSGDTGAGQTIAIMGQSAVSTSDITNFQGAAGLATNPPATVLMPNTGTPKIFADGDEGESDLDLEWSGAIAPGATIVFVYTGSNTNYGVFDSLTYAVDQKIGNVLSISYGACEAGNSSSELKSMESQIEQSTTQGQSIIASSGDQGSTACYGEYGNSNDTAPVASDEVITVNYPASSAYVTGVGGTEITNADNQVGAYWSAAGSSGISLNTVLSHIPEVAWNDDSASFGAKYGWQMALSSTGGGVSTVISRPSWQTGVTGIPTGTMRLVPDISLYSSPNNPGYLYCTSDTSDWATSSSGALLQKASCGNDQFYDDVTGYFNIAGGTSFAAPIFAGMVAIINQVKNNTGGQGLINPTLYTLASNSATYSSAFYDITAGSGSGTAGVGNECLAGTTYCSSAGTSEYPTTAGYDEATGLGSVNLTNLLAAWPAGSAGTLIPTATKIAVSPASPAVNATITFTISVASTIGSTVPSGTITLTVNGGTPFTETLTASGNYVYSTSFSAMGSYSIVAQYGGDATHQTSIGGATVTIATTSSGTGSFTMAPSPGTLTVTQGTSGNEFVTINPGTSGYTGTVLISVSTASSALANLCVDAAQISNHYAETAVTGTTPVQIALMFDTNAGDCYAGSPVGVTAVQTLTGTKSSRNNTPNPAPLGVAFAGLLLAGFMGRRSRKLRGMAGLIVLFVAALALSSCGSSNKMPSTTVPANPAKGSYTVTLTGVDSVTSSITAQTSFTLVIQ
jgi:subtilase family serine protease